MINPIILYIAINAFCIVLLAIILYSINRFSKASQAQTNFITIIIFDIILLVSVIIYYICYDNSNSIAFVINYISMYVYILLLPIPFICHFFYLKSKLNPSSFYPFKHYFLWLIPYYFQIVIVIINMFTPFLFSISKINEFSKGNFFILVTVVPIFFFVCDVILFIRHLIFDDKTYSKKSYFILFGSTMLPFLGLVLQFLVPSYSIIWYTETLAMLFLFYHFQKTAESIDALTGLNNRRQLDMFLSKLFITNKMDCYLFCLLDIDNFKKINDVYGHVEGDNALIEVSSVIKHMASLHHGFVSRYGGDEFAVLIPKKGLYLEFEKDVKRGLKILNKSNRFSFKLMISIGVIEYNPNTMKTESDFLHSVDLKMYENKRIKRGA